MPHASGGLKKAGEMARTDELSLFLVRTRSGRFHLVNEEGSLILEAPSYRELRRDLHEFLDEHASTPLTVAIYVGRPPRGNAARSEHGLQDPPDMRGSLALF
jgi:hypothetical protein